MRSWNDVKSAPIEITAHFRENMRMSAPLNEAKIITSSDESLKLITALSKDSSWGINLLIDLQGVAVKDDGTPLLTSWLSIDEFISMGDSYSQDFKRLFEHSKKWKEMGCDQVFELAEHERSSQIFLLESEFLEFSCCNSLILHFRDNYRCP